MLRDLHLVVEDLQRGMQAATVGSGVHITNAEMVLPVEAALVLKDGGCAMLADVSRNHADAQWLESPSRLRLVWGEVPTEDLVAENAP